MCSDCSAHQLRIRLGQENVQGYTAEILKNPDNKNLQLWLKRSQEYLNNTEANYRRHRQNVHGERFVRFTVRRAAL